MIIAVFLSRALVLWSILGTMIFCTGCASKYELTRQSIPTAYGSSNLLRVSVAAPTGWKTSGPGKDNIAFQPTNCQRPDCPIIGAALFVGSPYDPVPTQADTAKEWWDQIDKNVAVKETGSFSTDAHGTLTIYHFSSSTVKEQLTVFVIHNQETVAVTLSNVANGNFQPYIEALKQVASSVWFHS